MTWRNVATTAATVAAAVTVSACSSSVGGAPVAVPATATPSVTVAGSGSGTEPIRWVNVQSEAPVLPRDLEGLQYGTTPTPGVGFGYRNAAKQAKVCTLGPAVSGADGRTGFLTAGHCTAGLAPTPAYLQGGVDTRTAPQVLMGTVEGAQDDDSTVDSAVIWAPAPADTGRIAGRWPVAGIMARADVQNLVHPGDPVCVLGARSGVVCSPLVSATGGSIRTQAVAQGGDSGGAVFVVAPSGSAIVIGIHSAAESGVDEATFISPALDRLHAAVVTASQ